MSKQQSQELVSIMLGTITSVGIGTFLLHAVSAFILAIIGALGGWFFQHFIRPKLDKWKKSRSEA